ncbi:hypothetical protein BDQ12DRAFT_711578 [Crucibulum laeve]|uniref:Uncharacterized protein n=1 Tax=Crucibulum laeve TaxID=68775 RepID=A0A5C3MG65_9AGAR|nr:hypothetical protein BDQ12DRAFT_711578 [Crucibulum laeve]
MSYTFEDWTHNPASSYSYPTAGHGYPVVPQPYPVTSQSFASQQPYSPSPSFSSSSSYSSTSRSYSSSQSYSSSPSYISSQTYPTQTYPTQPCPPQLHPPSRSSHGFSYVSEMYHNSPPISHTHSYPSTVPFVTSNHVNTCPPTTAAHESLLRALDFSADINESRAESRKVYRGGRSSISRASTLHPYSPPATQHGGLRSPTPTWTRAGSSDLLQHNTSAKKSRCKHCKNCTCAKEHESPISKDPEDPDMEAPTNHILLPQRIPTIKFASRSYEEPRYPPITFQALHFPEAGMRLGKVIDRCMPAIEGGDDTVLEKAVDREITIKLMWPGYSTVPFQKRIKTLNGKVTRETILMVLAKAIIQYVRKILVEHIPVEAGFEKWAIGIQPNGRRGIIGPEVFVTRLIHCGGSYWRPELWIPKTV